MRTDVPEEGLIPASDDRMHSALTTEYFTLQGARSATVSESNGRMAVFLSTVSSFVVALAFVAQISGLGEPFFAFAAVLLPALLFLGTVTYVRVLQSGIEDLVLTFWSGPSALILIPA